MYLLGLLKDYGSEFMAHLSPFTGLQSSLDFSGDGSGGRANNALIIVTFANGGNIIKTTLE